MKIFKILAVALVAMLGFTACNNEPEHIYDDHSKDIVGTWTCLTDNYAEALIIKADGSALSTGYDGVDYWENVAGNVVVENGIVTMTFEDNDNFKGHFDIVPGMAFSIYTDEGERYTYNYCKEDLTEEVVGRWVWVDSNGKGSENMGIQTFNENGTGLFTGGYEEIDYKLNEETTYKVVGDLLIQNVPNDNPPYMVRRLTYNANGSSYGAILTTYSPATNYTASWLRVKQSLNLAGKAYAYNTAYVTSAKGIDEDFSIMGHIFNIAKIKASDFDVMFGADLFLAEFPNSNTMKHRFHIDGQDTGFDAQIVIEENKVTIDMSVVNPALRKVDMYMFQDADDSQLHMYMPTASFINYFANMELYALILEGEINQTDEAAIAKVFADMEARVESINVSFVLKALK
ncbi:MAG: hypothetical protein J6S09_00165 [Paludibacteraceae bacterium]|nr:hypothetical protein [Paludibacteraceae bacterium]